MYIYYEQVELEEHMPYAKEICEVFRIHNENGKNHSRFMIMYLNDYAKKIDPDYRKLYYQTKNGLVQVFPRTIYEPAIKNLLKKLEEVNKTYSITVGIYIYKVIRGGR